MEKMLEEKFRQLNPAVRSFYRILALCHLHKEEWFRKENNADKTDWLDAFGLAIMLDAEARRQELIAEEFEELREEWAIPC